MHLQHTLCGLVLLVQAAALPADNPQRTTAAFSTWQRSATFATEELCQETRAHKESEQTTVYNEQAGVIIRFRYRCANDDA